MSSLAHAPNRFYIRISERPRAATDPTDGWRLLPSGDGWSLIGPDGRLVFEALGTRGRRQCLEFARTQGVLVVHG